MQKAFFLLLLALPASGLTDAIQDVRCHEIGFSRAVEIGDRAWFESFIGDDARFVGRSVRRGVAEISEGWSVFFDPDGPRIQWRPQIVEVLESGDLALSRGPFRVTGKDAGGNPTETWGTFNSTWRRQADGDWKVVFDAGSSEPESPSEQIRILLDQADTCGNTMNPEALQALALAYADAWSSGDPALFASFYAEDATFSINDGERSVGREAIERTATGFMTAFPDMVVRLVEVRRRGTAVEFHWHWTGTNTGPDGTGNAVDLTGYEEWKLDASGLILESRGHMDDAEYERQLNAG